MKLSYMNAQPDSRVAVVLGTRPELVKLAEPIRLLGPAARVIHTGQHYDDTLSGNFLDELGLPEPEYLTGVGGQPRAVQVAAALAALDERFAAERPRAVIVQGDTNAALSGALAANARSIPLIHVEAGLRSHDRAMPEEHNRVVIDRLADVLCAATPENRALLLAEGVPDHRIEVTGNTVVEAVHEHLPPQAERTRLLDGLGLTPDAYVLATVHRPENTDDSAVLATVLRELAALGRTLPVVLPLHPRTRARIEAAGLGPLLDGMRVLAPTGYGTFLALARHAALLVSDSGGIQEETTVLGRPPWPGTPRSWSRTPAASRRRPPSSAAPWWWSAAPPSAPRPSPTSRTWWSRAPPSAPPPATAWPRAPRASAAWRPCPARTATAPRPAASWT